MHGQCNRNTDRQLIGEEDTSLWLSRREQKVKQWQHKTRHYKQNIEQKKYCKEKPITNADCQQFDETIDRIISACPVLAKEQYIKGHDSVCAEIQFNICRKTEVKLDKILV